MDDEIVSEPELNDEEKEVVDKSQVNKPLDTEEQDVVEPFVVYEGAAAASVVQPIVHHVSDQAYTKSLQRQNSEEKFDNFMKY